MNKLILFASLFIWTVPLHAAVTWDWSFGDESGTFITDGTSHEAGTYTLIDFTVTSSSVAGAIGSLSGGQYRDGDDLATNLPYSFVYDGVRVTDWLHSGSNDFDWWVFQNNSIRADYFFGWAELCDDECFEVNDPSYAAINLLIYGVTVTPSAVPLPAAAWLFGSALLGLGVIKRKRF